MSECLHLLPPEQCSLCAGLEEVTDPDNLDYVQVFQDRVEGNAFEEWHKASPQVKYQEVPLMGIRLAGSSVNLNTLADTLIGIRYLGSDQVVTTTFGTQTAARAQVVDLEAKQNRGSTLVFQQAIANEIRSQGSDWVVGVLRHEPHPTKPDFTMYVLDTDGVDLEAAVAAFQEAGIDPTA